MTTAVDAPAGLSAWSLARDYPAGDVLTPHCHAEGQLIYVQSGVMELQCAAHLWWLPPQRGVWVPSGMPYRMRARSAVSLCTLSVMSDSRYLTLLPTMARALTVSGLLRELILRLIDTRQVRCSDAREQRLMQLLVDELNWSEDVGLPLPQDADPRLLRLCHALLADPADRRSLAVLAPMVGASARTLSRLFAQHLGMSFQLWRQQLSVMSALPRLAAGVPVSVVAMDLGYDNPGAFAAMFRRVMHLSPSAYALHCSR